MSIEVGNEPKGGVTGIKKFDALVGLPEGKGGLVHVSEVAGNYVENVEEHLSIGDEVDVKILFITDSGKISFSIKKAKDRSCKQHTGKPSHQESVQKAKDFEKKLSNFLKDNESKLTSVKRQAESRRGGKGSRC